MTVYTRLLSDDATPFSGETLEAWWPQHASNVAGLTLPMDRALLGGLRADRLAFAFSAGYRAALASLVPTFAGGALVALCATEAGGNHPRAIQTRLSDGALQGEKSFVTLGDRASALLVIAREGERADGRPLLRAVVLPSSREGVRVTPLPELPFVPEIAHAQVTFAEVRVAPDEVLPGDGYAAYLKPFRTVEDVHVHGALTGFLLGVGRRSGWAPSLLQRLLALAAALRELSTQPPLDAGVHLALAGVFAECHALLAELEPAWASVDAAVRTRWERDRALLNVAGKARTAREAAAWETVSGPSR